MRINLDEAEQVEPSMAPLLDCIFLLLIFFLVATTFDKQKPENKVEQLKITLPNSAAALADSTESLAELVIAVNRHGQFMVNNARVNVEQLHNVIKQQAANNPGIRVRIDGDRDTPLQHIVHLLDLCEFEGLNNIGVRAASNADY